MKNHLKNLSGILFIFIILSSCTGEEVGRLPVNAISTEDNLIIKEQSLNLKKGDEIGIWSEMDMEYEGDAPVRFKVQILKDGKEFGGLEIDPTDKNISMGEVKTTIMDKTSWSFTGKNKSLTIEEDGNYIFKALLVAAPNNTLKIKKAELVLKK